MAIAENTGRSAPRIIIELGARQIGVAPEGAAIVCGLGVAAAAFWMVGLNWVAGAVLISALAAGAFFRDPERFSPAGDGVVLSAADGRVVEIAERALPPFGANALRQVSVFMSPLNVHVNRAPVSGEVLAVEHTAGQFRAAFNDHASQHNERNLIVLADGAGRRHGLVQVAGYLARRIVCRLRNRDKIQQGQRIGLIMFGSRVDHFIPMEYALKVKIGDRVRAGETALGELTLP